MSGRIERYPIALSIFTIAVAVAACGLAAPRAAAQGPGELLTDRSRAIDFRRGGIGAFSEGIGGAAWLDYDGDGDLDLFMTNRPGRLNALYRNDGGGRFRNVAVRARVAGGLGSKGVAAADVDNEGCTDLFLTGEGGMVGPLESRSRLLANDCNGRFVDVTQGSGIDGPVPALMAAFGDVDGDGDLDLFVTSPGSFFTGRQTRSKLYRNDGDFRFTDVSASAGIDTALGACVVGFHDHDGDGRTDIYVGNCNDLAVEPTPFELFRNDGDLKFTDVAAQAGLDVPGFWMSIAFGDADGDGDLDLFSTSGGLPMNSPHALFRNEGDGTYTDVGVDVGLGWWEFGWGSAFTDLDNDGDEDLVMTGSFPPFGIVGPGRGNPGRVFRNDGGQFTPVRDFGLERRYTSGLAVADYDGDGFDDLVIVTSRLAWPVRSLLLRNDGNGNRWITVRPVGTASNRDGVGAVVRAITDDGRVRVALVTAGSSFLSTHSPWPGFGLGTHETARIEVAWPSGLEESFGERSWGGIATVVEGTGTPL